MIFIHVLLYRPRSDCHDVCVRDHAPFRLAIPVKVIYPVTVSAQLTYNESRLFPLLKYIHVRYLSNEFPVGHIAHVGHVAHVAQSIQLIQFAHVSPTAPVAHCGH